MKAGRAEYQRLADDCYCNFYLPSPVIESEVRAITLGRGTVPVSELDDIERGDYDETIETFITAAGAILLIITGLSALVAFGVWIGFLA